MPDKQKVLIVDDEVSILNALKRGLRKLPYHFIFIDNPLDALKLIKEKSDFAVIMSDKNMPGMDGIELLKQAKKYSPKSSRFMLSAFKDFQEVITYVNKGILHQFFVKPWDIEEIQLAIKNGVDSFIELQMEDSLLTHGLLFDPVLGLPSKQNSINHLNNITDQESETWAVILFSLDNYEQLQIAHGEQKASLAFKELATSLKDHLPNIFAGRFSENSLLLLTPTIQNHEDCIVFFNNLNSIIPKNITVENMSIPIECNFSVAFYPLDGISSDYILRCAKIAHLEARNSNEVNYSIYKPS